MKVFGVAEIEEFGKRHAASRKPLQRFLRISLMADWRHFPAVKESFPATDYAPSTGTMIFDLGGNKYRLIARVDFEEQSIYIQRIMTHDEYNRESF